MAFSCKCWGKKMNDMNARMASKNKRFSTTAAAVVAARERQRFCTPKYTVASSNSGTGTTQINWNPGPSCCIHEWNCKVGVELKRMEANETSIVDSVEAKIAASDETGCGSAERNDNEAGPSGINASVAASGEVEGTGYVNGRRVINRLLIERLFASSDDSDDDWWDPDEGFHEVFPEGNNF
jgi:hypothetical protein